VKFPDEGKAYSTVIILEETTIPDTKSPFPNLTTTEESETKLDPVIVNFDL
jgi:hypothetical protein